LYAPGWNWDLLLRIGEYRLTRILSVNIGVFWVLCAVSFGSAADAPPQSAAAGYSVNTFTSQFAKRSFDLRGRPRTGSQWYIAPFFHFELPDRAGLIWNGDGSITLGAANTITIATAAPTDSSARWVGQAFGGGAYFEAVLKFDPRDVVKAHGNAWPAFWSMAIEHLAETEAQHWKGQEKEFMHFIEPDFFEYDLWLSRPVWLFGPPNGYGGAMHDWFGIYKRTCPDNYCHVSNSKDAGTRFTNFKIEVPANTDFRQYHKYGFLWVPASDRVPGYAQYYFDGKLTSDRVTWTKYADQPPPPGMAPWTFGVIDRQHLAVILDTGASQPMTVQSVNVWQSSRANNVTQ
jgi:hypothetical protein